MLFNKNMEYKEIINNKYLTINNKGEGATSKVFEVKDIKTEKVYAAKVFKKSYDYCFLKEIEILNTIKKVNNPYIINMIESNISENGQLPTEEKKYIILEYASKGDLSDYISLAKNGLKEKYCKLIFYKILKGIQACHNAGICHRDLKLQNILLDENFNPKICDFGFATFNEKNLKDFLGTLNYSGPEIILGKPYDGLKADIFSLGVILLNLTTSKMGFLKANKDDQHYRLIMTQHYKQYWKVVGEAINKISDELKKLYIKMVSYRPEKRPTIEEILNDEWMKEINVLNKEEFEELENEIREELLNIEELKKSKNEKYLKI